MGAFPSAPGAVVSCEHASRRVPDDLRPRFRTAGEALRSHRGWDPGAIEIACALAGELAAPLAVARVSRLVVDCNRSPTHPRIFSEWTKALTQGERDALLARWHAPHRQAVERLALEAANRAGACAHLSVHSFTPVLEGRARPMDVGLLFDPRRAGEKAIATAWRDAILRADGSLIVHFNAPYRGVSNGLTTFLRTRFGPLRYAGIELEVNQRLVGRKASLARIADLMATTAAAALSEAPWHDRPGSKLRATVR